MAIAPKQIRTRGRVIVMLVTAVASMVLAAAAIADVITSDADTIAVGNQASRNLGNVAPGATLTPQVSFQLDCAGNKHADAGQRAILSRGSATLDGSSVDATVVGVTSASIGVIPAAWPDDGIRCPTPAPTAIQDNGNSTVTFQAPATPGSHTVVVNYGVALSPVGTDDSASITGSPSVTFTFNVVVPDTTAPSVAITSPADGLSTTSSSISVGGTASDTSGIESVKVNGDRAVFETGTWSLSGVGLACGSNTITALATDNSANHNTASTSISVTRVCDTTPPVITKVITGTAGDNGWYTSNVAVQWTVSDPNSAIVVDSGCGTQNFTSSTAAATSSCSAHSAGGSASDSVTLKIDKEAPEVSVIASRAANPNGWYSASVSFSAGASDNGPSGPGTCDADNDYSGPDSPSASVSMNCTDGAGNVGSGSKTFKYDGTAPSVTVSADRTPDHNGWYNRAVTFTASGSNYGPSGPGACDPVQTYDGPDDGSASASMSCTDDAGNNGSDSTTFKYDATAPSVTVSLARAADHNGWYNHAVAWSTSGTDTTSGIDSCDSGTYSGPDGTNLTVSGQCLDTAGNTSANVTSATFNYDATAPANIATTLDRGSDQNGWYNHAVDWTTSGQDAASGIASCDAGTYSGPDGTGRSVSGKCIDYAGNDSASAISAAFKYDATKPTLNPSVSPNPVNQGGSATASPGASDATSGIASSSCGAVNTSTIGDHTVSCSATDNAGNPSNANARYHVNYNWAGFFQPIDNGAMNIAKSGSTVPVKFSLDGNQGLSILAAGSPSVNNLSCSTYEPTDAIEQYTTATSGLKYDATANQYIYNWKTQSGYAGTCKRLIVRLADGSVHTADFRFTR